jgi:hypothetical protein
VQLLRDCGYRALEMASTDEVIVALKARMTAHLFFGASQILDMRVHQFWPKSMGTPSLIGIVTGDPRRACAEQHVQLDNLKKPLSS